MAESKPVKVETKPEKLTLPKSIRAEDYGVLEPYKPENDNLWKIRYTKGGLVPKCLSGKYTSHFMAVSAIDAYNVQKAQ